jgi:hypothetical protein
MALANEVVEKLPADLVSGFHSDFTISRTSAAS